MGLPELNDGVAHPRKGKGPAFELPDLSPATGLLVSAGVELPLPVSLPGSACYALSSCFSGEDRLTKELHTMPGSRYHNLPHISVALLAAALIFASCAGSSDSESMGGQPDGSEPVTGDLEGGRPDNGRPDNGRPDNGRPDTAQPDTGQPDTGRPVGCSPPPTAGTFWSLSAEDRDTGQSVRLCKYRGKVVLVANVAAS